MSKWEPDRFVDEIYDEWCDNCNTSTEHTMGACFPCMYSTRAAIKNKKTADNTVTERVTEGESYDTDN
jgi:hypothetical protein